MAKLTAEQKAAEKAAKDAQKAAEKAAGGKANYDHSEIVEIVGTSNNPHMKAGKSYHVNGKMANALINKGMAEAK